MQTSCQLPSSSRLESKVRVFVCVRRAGLLYHYHAYLYISFLHRSVGRQQRLQLRRPSQLFATSLFYTDPLGANSDRSFDPRVSCWLHSFLLYRLVEHTSYCDISYGPCASCCFLCFLSRVLIPRYSHASYFSSTPHPSVQLFRPTRSVHPIRASFPLLSRFTL